jgi:ankyrin repeat protein
MRFGVSRFIVFGFLLPLAGCAGVAATGASAPPSAAPLLVAARDGDLPSMQTLLQRDDLVIGDKTADSALLVAAANGRTNIVRTLVRRGVALDARNKTGDTALILAAMNGHEDVVTLLIDAGAHVNAREHYGITALMLAADGGHEGIVEKLVAAGANVNITLTSGESALSLALDKGHRQIISILRASGAREPLGYRRPRGAA